MTDTPEQFAKTEWPTKGPDFNPWHLCVGDFAGLIERSPGLWLRDPALKYVSLRIDTRDGSFIVMDRDGNRINPDRLMKAANDAKERGYNRAYASEIT